MVMKINMYNKYRFIRPYRQHNKNVLVKTDRERQQFSMSIFLRLIFIQLNNYRHTFIVHLIYVVYYM